MRKRGGWFTTDSSGKKVAHSTPWFAKQRQKRRRRNKIAKASRKANRAN